MNNGWIKLHRRLLNNPISNKPDYLTVWIVLLLLANHSDHSFIWNNEKIIVKRGQIVTGRKELSKKTGVNESKVERILKYLKSEQQIEQQTTTKFRLITVNNYDIYQENEQQNEQQVNNKRTTSEQQVNTNKNDNNYKKEKNDKKDIYINKIYKLFKSKINSESRLTDKAKKKIQIRLKEYTVEELEKAIVNFASDAWWFEHNAHRGVAWFFHSEERIEQFLNLGKKFEQRMFIVGDKKIPEEKYMQLKADGKIYWDNQGNPQLKL